MCLTGYFCFWLVPETFSERTWLACINLSLIPFTAAQAEKVAFYLVTILLYQTGYAAYQVPYTSLTMHLSDEPRERDSGTTVRMFFETSSALFSSVFQGSHV